MNKNILYIMIGAPGSGKTTIAKNTCSAQNNTIHISRDEIRFSLLQNKDNYFSKERETYKEFTQQINKNLAAGYNVIADATHLNMFSRCKLMQALDTYTHDYKIIFVVFNVSADICVERDKAREGRRNVPENIIRNMCRDFRVPTKDEDERVIDIIEVNND